MGRRRHRRLTPQDLTCLPCQAVSGYLMAVGGRSFFIRCRRCKRKWGVALRLQPPVTTTSGEDWREHRERRQAYRASLEPCWNCGAKEHPVLERCRCGAPNPNHRAKTPPKPAPVAKPPRTAPAPGKSRLQQAIDDYFAAQAAAGAEKGA